MSGARKQVSSALLFLAIGALVGVGVGVAVAAASARGTARAGALYQGKFGGNGIDKGAQESVSVSANGRQVASVSVLPIECGPPGGPAITVHNVPIVNGSFTAKYPGLHFRSGVFGSATVTGRFLAHGRASGTEDVRTNDTFTGSVCKYSEPWTAVAQPQGSKQCPTHGLALNIIVAGTTCAVIDHAVDKGKYVSATPSQPAGVFTTPGWKCRVVKGGVQNHQCTRTRPHKASFSFAT
jgi:hypothetical protein